MNCKEAGKLFLDYLDGDIGAEKREAFDEHLASCKSCQLRLTPLANSHKALHQAYKIMDARTSVPSGAWASFKQRLEIENKRRLLSFDWFKAKLMGWLSSFIVRPLWQKATTGIIATAIIITLTLIGPLGGLSQIVPLESVLEKVYAATTEIDSFHMETTVNVTNTGGFTQRYDFYFVSPDRTSWVMYEQGIKETEVRTIGNDVYKWSSGSGSWELMEGILAENQASSMQSLAVQLEPDYAAGWLEQLDYIEKLPDEVIDGVRCEHYRGSYEQPNNLDELREQIEVEADPDRKERLQEQLEEQERWVVEANVSSVLEIWVGKDDHILWQTRFITSQNMVGDTHYGDTLVPEGTRVTHTATSIFNNFNKPVDIEAPAVE